MAFRVGLKNYGLPYMGSKSQIAPWVIRHLPSNDTFVDLFAGGCAVTHAAMRSDKYKHFIANDISDVPQFFVDAINGKYDNETRWISREDFHRLKDSDPYVRYVWSFGNNGRTYLYGRDIEPIKKAIHYAVYFNDASEFEKIGFRIPILLGATPMERYRELTAWIRNKNVNWKGDGIANFSRLNRVKQASSITGLNSHVYELPSAEATRRLQSADITVYRGGYDEVEIPKNSTVYCDPPYRNTAEYLGGFDTSKFDNWVRTRNFPVYVSEYSMPSDFERIAVIGKISILHPKNRTQMLEGIYLHKRWIR